MRCAHCGETSPLVLEPRPNGAAYCTGCDHVTPEPQEPRLVDTTPRVRRDLE